jgi:hypothetical protein
LASEGLTNRPVEDVIQEAGAATQTNLYEEYYMQDELFGNEHYLDAPPVPVVCIYGINLDTEVSVVVGGKAPTGTHLLLDRTPLQIESLEYYDVREGVIYETARTPQPLLQHSKKTEEDTV